MNFSLENGKKNLKLAALLSLVAGASAGLGVFTVVLYQVFFGDYSELKKSTILARINEETTIYTVDEETKIGSFFEDAHRSYVSMDDIPAHMIRAMVAAEDKNFYNHVGVDPIAISNAFFEGLFNGFRFRRGGSTITQQTVKNIMDRREHTFKRKFKEMIRALQLERLYDKRQILEFYLNQFHVTANGNGIGIAAQYYFSKDVRDLTLVEAAFIAGSVKAPSKYNPFVKYTQEQRDKAWVAADDRKNYVLRRMYEQGWISEEELKSAWEQRVPFKKGKFRTHEVALVSLIRSQLKKKEILEALGLETAAELDNAGLKIYTTIDAKLQAQAQLMVRRNLSRLEFILKGFETESPEEFRPLRSLDVNEFYLGKVAKVVTGPKPEIHIDFGLPKGVIPYDSIMRTAMFLNLPTYKGHDYHVKEIISKVKEGDVLLTEVKEYDSETHQAVLELKKYPNINGGLMAVDKGEVRAVVAGFEPKGYNRAVFATRQPGSVFKSVVYFAALQLGWSFLDRLDNERRVFPFQGHFYYPRPDHISPYKDVSMLWAGVKSENLASIYLTDHLLDKLNFGQFKALMKFMGLMPIQGESPADFHYRVARETGVQLDNAGVKEHLLAKAIDDLKPDLIFAGQGNLVRQLDKMYWGRGYQSELQNLYNVDSEDVPDKERALRIDLLKNNYMRMEALAGEVLTDWDAIAALVTKAGPEGAFGDEQGRTLLSRFRVMSTVGNRPTLAYVRSLPDEKVVLANEKQRVSLPPSPGRALNPLDVQAIWGEATAFGDKADLSVEDVHLEGYLPLKYFKRVKIVLEERMDSVMGREDKFSLYRYFNHHDFRIVLGLRYLVDLTRNMGVYSRIEPVLSFPLGTNDVSVAEVAKVYQTFTEGKVYRFYKEGPANQLNFIRRIEDREGNVLFEPKKEEKQIVDTCVASQMNEILRKVVTHGTGRRARGELYLTLDDEADESQKSKSPKVRVQAFGKTGTTNDYTTSYFAGFFPYPTIHRAPLDPGHSYVLASYVGYDFNKQMRRGSYKISGAYGALPVWTDFAKAIIKEKNYAEYLDRLDINVISRQVWPMQENNCTTTVSIDLPQGAILSGGVEDGDEEVFEYTDIENEGETFFNEFARNASVRSGVQLATSVRGGVKTPMRLFQPFTRAEELEPKEFIPVDDTDLDAIYDGGSSSTAPLSSSPPETGGGASAPEAPPATAAPAPAPVEQPQLGKKEEKAEGMGTLQRSIQKLNQLFQDKEKKPEEPAGDKEKMIPKEEDDPGYIEEDLW